MTYTQSLPTIPFMLVSAMGGKFAVNEAALHGSARIMPANEVVPVIKGASSFGNEFVRQHLLHLKARMESAID
ncbi:hypothetical protein KDK_47060 [Dictyobacter kobayashii]|uniref:Uncharacterized protein n=1 Tax=Dictyobacter kobayashii TaxID=2014872 RepID=A0A402AP66_9CHLR|nr:hypothetical protein KDK_47060 [Dictyobacter kobayashii]